MNKFHASPLRGEWIFGRALARKVEVRRYSADTPNNPRQAGQSPDEGGYGHVNSYYFVQRAHTLTRISKLTNVH